MNEPATDQGQAEKPQPFIPVLFTEDTLRPVPCLAVLYFFVAGSMPLSLVAFEYCGVSTAVVLMLVMTGAGWTLFPESCRRCRFMVLAGMGLALLHSAAPWRSYERHLLRPEVYAEIRAVVIEDHLRFGDDEVLDFLGDTRRVQVRVTHMRLSRDQQWQRCGGRVLLPWLDVQLRYGQTIEARGSFRLPHKSALPGRMDYPAYLRTKGIRHLYYPSEITTISETPTGWRRGAAVWFEMRERLLARVVRGLEHPENQSALAAMTLGFRQSLDSDQRNTYLKSGMIHIFAISGLHVGILFALLLPVLTLCRVPFHARYMAAPVILLVYVLIIGAAPAAMRAWLMLSIWSVGRGLKLPVTATNSILTAALVLLLVNPFLLFQPGFQFSFLIVLCLIWGWGLGREMIGYALEIQLWVPARARTRSQAFAAHAKTAVLASVAAMTAAWLGGIGLTAWYNGLFLPGSVLTNLLVSVLAWLVIFLAVVKGALSFLPFAWPEAVAAGFLDLVLSSVRMLAEAAAEYGGARTVARPPLVALAVYYPCLLIFFMSRNHLRRAGVTGLVLLAAIAVIVAAPQRTHRRPQVHLLIPEGSTSPITVILPADRGDGAIVINTGPKRFGTRLADWLRINGVSRVDMLIITAPRAITAGGAPAMLDAIPVRTVAVLANSRRGVHRLETAAWQHGVRWRLYYRQHRIRLGPLTVEVENEDGLKRTHIHYVDRTGNDVTVESQLRPFQASIVDVSSGDGDLGRTWEFKYTDHDRAVDATRPRAGR